MYKKTDARCAIEYHSTDFICGKVLEFAIQVDASCYLIFTTDEVVEMKWFWGEFKNLMWVQQECRFYY